jgi:hypothetical protein
MLAEMYGASEGKLSRSFGPFGYDQRPVSDIHPSARRSGADGAQFRRQDLVGSTSRGCPVVALVPAMAKIWAWVLPFVSPPNPFKYARASPTSISIFVIGWLGAVLVLTYVYMKEGEGMCYRRCPPLQAGDAWIEPIDTLNQGPQSTRRVGGAADGWPMGGVWVGSH